MGKKKKSKRGAEEAERTQRRKDSRGMEKEDRLSRDFRAAAQVSVSYQSQHTDTATVIFFQSAITIAAPLPLRITG